MLSMAAVVAVLVVVVWILPGMLDWNRYRANVASLVGAAIGRPVQIDGNITLHLLPQPILTASDLKVNDAGDGVVMLVHEVRLRVALGPLLGGRVDARELELRGADLALPWPPPPGALSRRPPSWLTGLQARVEESRIKIGNFFVNDMAASLASDPETGTLSVAGTAKIFGLPWRVTVRLGRPDRDGAAPLDASLDGQGKLRDTGGTFSGTVAADGALSGHVAARGPDLAQVMPAPAVPWHGDGRLSAADGLAVADELALQIGGSPAHGAVAFRVQPDVRLDLAITAGRLDLDSWVPVLVSGAQGGKETSFPTGIDLSAEAGTLAGGTLRQVRAAFDIDQDGVVVRDAAALLPGDAKLTLHGRLPRNARSPSFEGAARLIAPNLKATLRWIEPFAPALLHAIPNDAFTAADLQAKVAIDPSQLSFTDVRGTLDGTAAQGGLAVRLGARLAVSGALSLDRMLLDPWLPDPVILDDPAAAFTRLGQLLAGAGFDADLKVQVRDAAWRGAQFGPVSLDMQSEAGRLTIRRLEATALGVHATVSGTIGDATRVSEGRIELTTQDVSPLRTLLPPDLNLAPALFRGSASTLIQVSGPPDALAVRAGLELGDLRFEVQPVINLPARSWTGSVTIHHPGAPRLLEQLGVHGTAPWLGDGSFSVIAQANVAPGRIAVSNVELVAGALRANGQLTWAGDALSGRIQADNLTLPMVHPRSPDPLPLAGMLGTAADVRIEANTVSFDLAPTVHDATAELVVQHGTLTIKNLSAKLSGGRIAGIVALDTGEKPRLSIRGQADDIAVPGPLFGSTLDLTSGLLSAKVNVVGEGYSPAALIATLSGSGSVSIADAAVTGFDLGAVQAMMATPDAPRLVATLQRDLTKGGTTFERLQSPLDARKGVLTIHASGAGATGSAAFDGTLDLLAAVMEAKLTLHPGPGLPDVAARLTGPADAPVRTPELAGVARWLAERP